MCPDNLVDLKARKRQDESQSSLVIKLREERDRLLREIADAHDEGEKIELQEKINDLQKQIDSGHKGVKEGVDATRLDQAG